MSSHLKKVLICFYIGFLYIYNHVVCDDSTIKYINCISLYSSRHYQCDLDIHGSESITLLKISIMKISVHNTFWCSLDLGGILENLSRCFVIINIKSVYLGVKYDGSYSNYIFILRAILILI